MQFITTFIAVVALSTANVTVSPHGSVEKTFNIPTGQTWIFQGKFFGTLVVKSKDAYIACDGYEVKHVEE
jgi:hypothetical protein